MGTGPAGSVFGENSFDRETWGMEAPHCHGGQILDHGCAPLSLEVR